MMSDRSYQRRHWNASEAMSAMIRGSRAWMSWKAICAGVHAPFGPLTDLEWAHLALWSARSQPDGGFRLAYDPAIARAFAPPLSDADLWPLWDRIACPVLVIRGVLSDLLLSETAVEMIRRKPDTELVEFPECGHAPALFAAAQIAAIRDWLSRT